MRAPLHVINGFSDHIQEQLKISDPLGLLPDMSAIKRNGEHLNHLIDDILDYTRIKKGKMHLDISRFYLRTLFEDCKLTIDEILRQKNPSG
jgi:signal transduction histidine kinase